MRKILTYFDDAEQEAMPSMLEPVDGLYQCFRTSRSSGMSCFTMTQTKS